MPNPLPSLLGAEIPNALPESLLGAELWRPAGRLIWSSLVLLIGIAIAAYWLRRPKRSSEPATWAATIIGAIAVYGLMALAYGVVPHEWLTFASAHLNWGKDTFILTEDQFAANLPPLDVPKYVLADLVAVHLYVVFAVINIKMFAAWQQRKVAEQEAVSDDDGRSAPLTGPFARFRRRTAGTSAYGRPVTTNE
ncbi:MAG: hypothetical protein ACT4OX_14360 [Actinomycetota bacterium]